jgi:alkyl hydroperoxide reductase subunit AhpC/predicted Ser/Thr protein kinase
VVTANEYLCLRIGESAPDFELPAVSADRLQTWVLRKDDSRGRWLILVFYPRDFSFVCPTELTTFSARVRDFQRRNCDLIGISTDTIDLHAEWLRTPAESGGLGPLQFPLASDVDGAVSRRYGVWVPQKRVATRGLFIIDPQGILQYAVVHNLSVGRNAEEVLRVLDALRTGGMCPASWTAADGTLNVESALQPGRILGHYRIKKVLGSGTFGTVFAAWDIHLERMDALKVLGKAGEDSRDELLAEARAAASLSHPNICTIYSVEEEDGLPLIAMEYVTGSPLSVILREPIERSLACRIAARIAAGLAAAHERGIVHGDLKPANVMVTADGVPKILDFGLSNRAAKIRAARRASRRAEAGASDSDVVDVAATVVVDGSVDGIAGTPAYMSPEQAAGHPLTPASDAFTFGLLLHEMLSGQSVLTGCSPIEAVMRLRNEDFAAMLPGDCPVEFRPMLRVLLQRDPKSRPPLSEVAATLRSLT